MNCREWEERIALYAGGDLAGPEIERHLEECAACRTFAAGVRESLALLRDAHAVEVAPVHFAAVRARVISKLESKRRPWWIYGVVAAAAILLVLAMVPPAAGPRAIPLRQAAVQAPPREVAPAQVVIRAVHPKMHRRVRPAVAHAQTEPGPPIVVKMITDDPEVVIYWITDKSGE